MFWRFGGYANISTLDSILDKPDVTVEELLDESDLIQELKQQNSKLIEFLREETVLKKLLDYVVADAPPEESEDKAKAEGSHEEEEKEKERASGISFFGKGKGRDRSKSATSKHDDDGETEQEKQEAQRKKYAYVACEVLSSEVWSITEAILDQQDALREFWNYMHRPAPLDPLRAGYFTKVNEALLDKKTEEMLAFFKSLDGIVPAMLQHVDCPMVMDLLLKIISLEKHEGATGIVDWLQAQNLMPLLLGYLGAEHNSATQTSAGDFLKAIITISANATTQDQSVIGPNELTRQLVSEPCIKTLINDMLRGGNPLTVGVGIIIEVIRKNNSDYDPESLVGPEPKTSDPIYLGTLLREFASHVPAFMHLIRSPSAKKPELKAAFGRKIEPLGFDRFKTCELMAELLHCSNMGLLNERGAEEEARKRDAERERLKADGILATPKAPGTPSHENSHEEFGSSVDSHGFHHAEKPSDEEYEGNSRDGKKLEVQNTSDEDGFEKVTAPSDDLPDEVTFDDLDEKVENKNVVSQSTTAVDIPKPLSPNKGDSTTKSATHLAPSTTQTAADSPTSAGVTDRVNSLDMDDDTVMTELGEEPVEKDEDDQPTELERELSRHAEDTPAPLFAAKKEPADHSNSSNSSTGLSEDPSEDFSNTDQSVATIQGEERLAYETDADGKPVVGDLLKLQFVEHQVVPTILDFFFRFPWNNFLHNVVYDVVQQVFNGTLDRGYNRALAFDLYKPVAGKNGESAESLGLGSSKDITDRILDGQKASDLAQADRGMRLGYMGHLTLIAEEVCKFGNRHPPETLDQIVLDRVNRDEWVQYVEGTLTETREKDNAVLGGVRPENAMGVRQQVGIGSLQSGFTANTSSALSDAGIAPQDSLAMSEGTVGQSSFEINSGSMLSGFGDGDDDEEMEDEHEQKGGQRRGSEGALSEDEQDSSPTAAKGSIPPPLNIPPSRARMQLAARLAAKKKEAETLDNDPDLADNAAVTTASLLPQEPSEGSVDLTPAAEQNIQESGLQITGLRVQPKSDGMGKGPNRFSGLFMSDNSSSSGEDEYGSDEHEQGDGTAGAKKGAAAGRSSQSQEEKDDNKQRRPSTTEAKTRRPLDEDDDDDDDDDEEFGSVLESRHRLGAGPFADPIEMSDDSSDDEPVEIKPTRRAG